MSYKIHLDVFEGPLDLLIYLIKKNDVDIKDIPISEITTQYMQYIEMMKMLDLDIVGDFLVMAATLMQIKSKMLLPPDPTEQGEQIDPRDELVQRLTEYQKFKEIADTLKDKASYRQDLFSRVLSEETIKHLKDHAKEYYFEANLFDLINALTEALKKVPEETLHEIVKEEFTVENKIHEILHLLLDQPELKLSNLFGKVRSKMEAIVTFLAILELIRLKEIKVVQQDVFGDIDILRNKDNMIPVQDENFSQEENQQEETSSESPEVPS